MCYKKWSFHVYSDGWRHFLVCISSASERKETWINVHQLLGHPVSENFVSWCQTLKNSSASFFMHTGNLFHLHDLAIWKWLKKCVHKHIKENKANWFFLYISSDVTAWEIVGYDYFHSRLQRTRLESRTTIN